MESFHRWKKQFGLVVAVTFSALALLLIPQEHHREGQIVHATVNRLGQPASHIVLGLDGDEKVSRLDCFLMPVGLKRELLGALNSAKLFQPWPIAYRELKNIRYQCAPPKKASSTAMFAPKDDSGEVPF